jgi:hypothetical protein
MDISHYTYMPRKRSDENLTKVVSSIISIEDFEILEKYARVCYTNNLLKLPTISHMVRYILSIWADQRRKNEQPIRNNDLNKPALNKQSTRTVKRDQEKWLEYSKNGY